MINSNVNGLRFDTNDEGKWGYIPSGADTVIPFKSLEVVDLFSGTQTTISIPSCSVSGAGNGQKSEEYIFPLYSLFNNESINAILTNISLTYATSVNRGSASLTINIYRDDGSLYKNISASGNTSSSLFNILTLGNSEIGNTRYLKFNLFVKITEGFHDVATINNFSISYLVI